MRAAINVAEAPPGAREVISLGGLFFTEWLLSIIIFSVKKREEIRENFGL